MDSRTTSMVTFDTELGRCALRWSDVGISGVLLPKAGGRPGPSIEDGVAIPAFVREAIEGILAVMAGESRDLRVVPLDERGVDDFRRAVYAATRDIPTGTTRSYGEVARAIGRTGRGSGRRGGAGPQPVPDHRPVPPGRRSERGTHRVLGTGRPGDEAPDARARGRTRLRPAGPLNDRRRRSAPANRWDRVGRGRQDRSPARSRQGPAVGVAGRPHQRHERYRSLLSCRARVRSLARSMSSSIVVRLRMDERRQYVGGRLRIHHRCP